MNNPSYSAINRIVWGAALILLLGAGWLASSIIGQARASADRDAQDSHLRRAARAGLLYASEHDEHWPRVQNWERTLEPYDYKARRVLMAPIAMNRLLSGQSLAKLTTQEESTVAFFSSTLGGPSASGGKADLKRPDPMVSFLDGRARVIREPRLGELQW